MLQFILSFFKKLSNNSYEICFCNNYGSFRSFYYKLNKHGEAFYFTRANSNLLVAETLEEFIDFLGMSENQKSMCGSVSYLHGLNVLEISEDSWL